jgi:acyl-CoA reductase-like NAD-dependent aldehyde dehydrogenase
VIDVVPRTTEMLIGGGWRAAREHTFEDRDPATGELHANLAEGTAADIDEAVDRAREAFGPWAATDAAERGRVLMRLADALEREQTYISELESADNGRPRRETAAQAMIVANWFRYFGGMADKVQGDVIPVAGAYLNYTQRGPIGVCGAITPWNHPMLIAAKKVAPALACGNTVVVKPSELAPLSVLELARIAHESGLPAGVLNVVTGGRETGTALVRHRGVGRIDLTGSTATGAAVARDAAETLKRVGLELGGKAANVVFADADFERTVAGVVFSGYIAQGQSCVAGARVLVEESIAERFVTAMRGRVERIRVGDPRALETQMGPLITPAAAARVARHVDGSREDGATVLCGGAVPTGLPDGLSPAGYYLPTLVWTEDASIAVAQEEIFGPVVTVIPFRDEEHAVELANGVAFSLGAGVWTTDVMRAHRVAGRLEAGVVWINDYHRIDPASPWGGWGLSGYGRENGFDAVREYTATRSVWVGTEPSPMSWYDDDAGFGRLN